MTTRFTDLTKEQLEEAISKAFPAIRTLDDEVLSLVAIQNTLTAIAVARIVLERHIDMGINIRVFDDDNNVILKVP